MGQFQLGSSFLLEQAAAEQVKHDKEALEAAAMQSHADMTALRQQLQVGVAPAARSCAPAFGSAALRASS